MSRRRAQSAAADTLADANLFSQKNRPEFRGTTDCSGHDTKKEEPVAKWVSDQGLSLPTNTVIRQASQVFQELLQTESHYVNDLKILVNVRRIIIHSLRKKKNKK